MSNGASGAAPVRSAESAEQPPEDEHGDHADRARPENRPRARPRDPIDVAVPVLGLVVVALVHGLPRIARRRDGPARAPSEGRRP